jgi:hypothetical protein
MTVEIDYDRVWADYQASLVGTLRGFSSGIAGLDTWVPSEDPMVALRDLLDAAAAAGRATLAISFGPATRLQLSSPALQALAERYGDARVVEGADDLQVSVTKLTAPPPAIALAKEIVRAPRVPAPAPTSSPPRADVYAAALAQAARQIHHEIDIRAIDAPATDDLVAVTAAVEGAHLRLDIDPTSHAVAAARFAAAPATRETRALLDVFCRLVTRLPILAAAQQGLSRLEADLRDPTAPPPLPGIILPRAAHARFALPAALIAEALATYRARTGFADQRVAHHTTPGPRWLTATTAERTAMVTAVLATTPGVDVVLAAIEHDVRIVLRLPDHLASPARQSLLMAIERAIRRAVDPRLEVHAEERKDRNKLRRLAVVPA